MGLAEFRVLGPVEMRIDGQLVELGYARQRMVFAVLLVDAATGVPLGRMIERVWGQDAPETATDLVYGYVSRLRGRLAGAVGLARAPGGYRLDTDPDSVDLHRFRRLTSEARAAGEDEPGRGP
jgi:DNA-binding SARP family transcriptional activator